MTAAGEDARAPLRERPWFIGLMLFVFFPVGLTLFWRSDSWGWVTKWVVTVAVFAGVWVALGRLDV